MMGLSLEISAPSKKRIYVDFQYAKEVLFVQPIMFSSVTENQQTNIDAYRAPIVSKIRRKMIYIFCFERLLLLAWQSTQLTKLTTPLSRNSILPLNSFRTISSLFHHRSHVRADNFPFKLKYFIISK